MYLAGRMALLVTLFLVLVNIFNTVTTNTPKAEGLTAIEAWYEVCHFLRDVVSKWKSIVTTISGCWRASCSSSAP